MNGRAEGGRLLALLGATGIAICQPVLDTLGKTPETFVFRRADSSDLIVLALLVALVPPMALWTLGLVSGRTSRRARRAVHGATIGALVALTAVQAAGSWPWMLSVLTALALGVGAWVLVVRVPPARLWFQFLAVLPVVSVLLFCTASRASEAVTADGFEAAAGDPGTGAPIVLIVLDELPTASLLDERGLIDPVRFPNLARLADDGTWYRNHTTMSGWTATAVPAIFSGQPPDNNTLLSTDRPDNIFRLLSSSHDLVVSEPVTRLCPIAVCGESPIAPGGGERSEVSGDLSGLLSDAVGVWTRRVTGAGSGPALGSMQEELAEVSVPLTSQASTAGSGAEAERPPDLELVRQPVRVTAFIDAIVPGDRPMAAILHVVLPHHPWRFLPDGTVYAAPAEAADDPASPWAVEVRRQRHLLQASYADRIVGQILAQVRDAGFYDEAVVAVTADHGTAFPVGDSGRRYSAETQTGIMWVPLIVKAPAQTQGVVDDSNLQSIDVLPTLASLAGIDVPWDLPGAAAGDPAVARRGDGKQYHRHESILESGPTVVFEVDGAAGLRDLLTRGFPPVTDDEDPISALYRHAPRSAMVGRPFTPTGDAASDVLALDDRERLSRSDEPVVVISGIVDDPEASDVVAAFDGIVVATSPIYDQGGERRFLLLLPARAAVETERVTFGLVSASGTVTDAGRLLA